MIKITEQSLTEQASIEWFKQLGYEPKFWLDISTSGVLELKKQFR